MRNALFSRWLLLFILPLGLTVAQARSAGESPSAERQSLAQTRHDLDVQLERALQRCHQRFDVTRCAQQARTEHALAAKPVREREEALITAERRERAAAQRELVAQRQREFAEEDARRQAKSEAAAPRAPRSTVPGSSAISRSDPHHVKARAEQERRGDQAEQEAKRNLEAAEQRRRTAEAHRLAVQERNARLKAQQEAKGKAQPPLPTPSSVKP
jgi:hypothetical protein